MTSARGDRPDIPASETDGIDVIIPVHGKWELTRECLLALREQTIGHNVIVVDDAGGDETGAEISKHFPEVHLVTLAQNRGFGSACNAGIRHGKSPLVVLLNNDACAAPTFLEEIAAAFSRDATVGSIAPLVLENSDRIQALGITVDPTLSSHHRFQGQPRDSVDGPEFRLCGVYGAAAGYRREALEGVGLFDENFFMYHEDLDLSLRLGAAGWGVAAAPHAEVTHLSGGTTDNHSRGQRENFSYGRGYMIRAYSLLKTRSALRVLAIETLVCAHNVVRYGDVVAITGRWRGFSAGSRAARRPTLTGSTGLVDSHITLARSVKLRREIGRATRRQTT